MCFFFREVGGLFCFKGRGKAVLSAVARRRAVRARGSLDARPSMAGSNPRSGMPAVCPRPMFIRRCLHPIPGMGVYCSSSQSIGAMGFFLIYVFRKGRGSGLVRLFFFSKVLCSSLVERMFPLYPLHIYLCLYGFLDF
jgi:hypothetical protein